VITGSQHRRDESTLGVPDKCRSGGIHCRLGTKGCKLRRRVCDEALQRDPLGITGRLSRAAIVAAERGDSGLAKLRGEHGVEEEMEITGAG
jgi:hypothetical protein